MDENSEGGDQALENIINKGGVLYEDQRKDIRRG